MSNRDREFDRQPESFPWLSHRTVAQTIRDKNHATQQRFYTRHPHYQRDWKRRLHLETAKISSLATSVKEALEKQLRDKLQ